jgi:hypothetical protein
MYMDVEGNRNGIIATHGHHFQILEPVQSRTSSNAFLIYGDGR